MRRLISYCACCAFFAAMPAGCAVFEHPARAVAPASLSWLTSWVNQPLEMEPFDLALIKPVPQPAVVEPGNLLEITIWDLYEPGRPHTFPVRVTPERTIPVPLLEELPVAGQTVPQIETALVAAYQSREYLLTPRVLVRSLDAPLVKVHVTGAVQRPGFVEVTRDEATLFAALVSAGGLRKNAGTQIAVSHAAVPVPKSATPATAVPLTKDEKSAALSPESKVAEGTSAEPGIKWYDIAKHDDRETVRNLILNPGDTVTVRAVVPPVRIAGIVSRPGSYPLPAGRVCNVWQALDLAGGVQTVGVPLNVTLLRPAADGRGPQRWSLNVDTIDERPPAGPQVEPGDVIHVEQTAGSRITRSVKNLWTK